MRAVLVAVWCVAAQPMRAQASHFGLRFTNRQNGGADFRLVLHERTAMAHEVTLRRVPR